ncbi:unnamed protein product [Ectocarpus sp. 4 AP-2014]
MPLFSRSRSRSSSTGSNGQHIAVANGGGGPGKSSSSSQVHEQQQAYGSPPPGAVGGGKGTAPVEEAMTPSTRVPSADDEVPAADAEMGDRPLARPLAPPPPPQPQPALKPMQMKVRLSFRTDIGGMSENQDNCFIWRHEPSGSFVIGVLDGHGRDVGRLAAHVVQEFMQDWLSRRWGEVKENPAEAFRTLFREAHESMLRSFREHLQGLGWTVKDNGGYLMKRRSMTQPWSCVHGGTSASLLALVEGRTLYTANVGDSSALLAMQGRRVEVRFCMCVWAGVSSAG